MRENQPKCDRLRWKEVRARLKGAKTGRWRLKHIREQLIRERGCYAAVQGVNKEDQRTEWWRRGKQYVLSQEGVERPDLFTCEVTCSSPAQRHTHLDCKMRITCTQRLLHRTCIYFSSKPGWGIPFAIKITILCGFFSSIHSLFFRFLLHNFPAPVKERSTRTILLCYTCTCTACWVVINVNTGLRSNMLRKRGTAGPSRWSNWEFWAAPELDSWTAHGFTRQHILHFCGRVRSFLFEVK